MTTRRPLLDELMPRHDAVERHTTLVRAAPSVVYAAIRSADLATGLLPRILLLVRGLPGALKSPGDGFAELRRTWRRDGDQVMRLADFEKRGFRVVAERAPEELLIGLLGRFWTPTGEICREVTAETFALGPPEGMALAGWNFSITARGGGVCELATETRVLCAPDARRKFLLYWSVVQPGSGLIRRAMLRAIRTEAERTV